MRKILIAALLPLAAAPLTAGAQAGPELVAGDLNMRGNVYDLFPTRYMRELEAMDRVTIAFACTVTEAANPNGTIRKRFDGCRATPSPAPTTPLDGTYLAQRAQRQFTATSSRVRPGPVRFTLQCRNDGSELVCGVKVR